MPEVQVVFDLESGGDPMPLGLYVTTEEDIITYKSPTGEYRSAPVDCVSVVKVKV